MTENQSGQEDGQSVCGADLPVRENEDHLSEKVTLANDEISLYMTQLCCVYFSQI